jgi:hypothetical protein
VKVLVPPGALESPLKREIPPVAPRNSETLLFVWFNGKLQNAGRCKILA